VRVHLCWIFCLLLSLPLWAEDRLPQVQRELRARKFYFGEIDGRASDETVSAIMRFQEAKGIDRTGQLDNETLVALGFPDNPGGHSTEKRTLDECNAFVLRYLQAWQNGSWEQEADFLADVVNYYDDQNVSRDFIRATRVRENRRWPRRKSTVLNRIASLEPDQVGHVQVTARVRMEVADAAGPARVRTEDLVFRIQKTGQGWRIAALKLLE
jgi:hypothetical protein